MGCIVVVLGLLHALLLFSLPAFSQQQQQQQQNPSQKTYALVIGVSSYRNSGIRPLQFAHKDAELIAGYLQTPRGGSLTLCPKNSLGHPSESCNLTVLQQENANFANVRVAFDNLLEHRGKGITLILFIATHGYLPCSDTPDSGPAPEECQFAEAEKEAVFLFSDSSIEAGMVLGYKLDDLKLRLQKTAPSIDRLLVFLDFCHSGIVPWGSNAAPDPGKLADYSDAAGKISILTASSLHQKDRKLEFSYENKALGHGIFTYYLAGGLNGEVRPYPGQPGVLANALYAYVSKAVVDATSGDQTPFLKTTEKVNIVDDGSLPGIPGLAITAPEKLPRPKPEENRLPRNPRALQRHNKVVLPASGTTLLVPLPTSPAARREKEAELENVANRVIFDYLRGDETPQLPAAFLRCAEALEAAAILNPAHIPHQSRAAFCRARYLLFQPGGLQPAQPLLERAMQLEPHLPYAHNALGIAWLEEASSRASETAVPNAALSDAALEATNRALGYFRQAVRLAPYWPYPRHNIALTFALRGDYDQAIAAYREAIRWRPDYASLRLNLGLLYQKLNLTDEARQAFREALARHDAARENFANPPAISSLRAAINNALATLEPQKPKGRALPFYDQALSDDPDYSPALHNKALLLAAMGRNGEALQLWLRIRTLEPRFLAARLAYARALAQFSPAQTDSEFEQLRRDFPRSPAVFRAWAQALAAQDRFDEARNTLNQAAPLISYPNIFMADLRAIEDLRNHKRPASAEWQNLKAGARP